MSCCTSDPRLFRLLEQSVRAFIFHIRGNNLVSDVLDCLVLSPVSVRSRSSPLKSFIMHIRCLQLNEDERPSFLLERTQNGQISSTSLQSQPSFSSSQVHCRGDMLFDTIVLEIFVDIMADIIFYIGRFQWRFLI